MFRTTTCVTIVCDLCEYVMDEDREGIEHYDDEATALKYALDRGWSRLADGRVACNSDEHAALLASDAVARFETAAKGV